MITSTKKRFFESNIIEKIFLISILLLPIAFILGNLLINLLFLIISIIFVIDTIKNKKYRFIKDPVFWILSIFFISLLVNIIFSIDPSNSTNRVLKILLMISFTLQMKNYIQKDQVQFEKIVLGFWSFVFFIVLLDGFFEIIFGFNSLGFSTPIAGRIAGFFGDELVLGAFFHSFCLIFVCYVFSFFKEFKKSFLLMIIFLIVISFLIGERSNFIKVFLSLSLLSIFIIKLKLKYFLLTFFLIFITLFSFVNFSEQAKGRYFNQIKMIYETKGVDSYLKYSPYGAHYNAAYQIFKEYPVFGVGVKNYRIESGKEKYRNDKYEWTEHRSTTHPHQMHFELLSETGIFGYMFFLIFILYSLYLSIKNYLKNRNIFQLSAIIYIIFYLTPLLPSGSYFSTFSSGLFWINYSIMMGYVRK